MSHAAAAARRRGGGGPAPGFSPAMVGYVLCGVLSALTVALDVAGAGHTLVFLVAAAAMIGLAWLIGQGTEHLGAAVGPRAGGILNAAFGNAAELIITFFALRAGLIDVVKASITGSILGNMLLALG